MAQRLKGQEVVIKLVRDSVVVTEISAIGSFNDNVDIEMKQDAFLGEQSDQYDDHFKGYTFDLEFQIADALWVEFQLAVISRASRAQPGLVFNVVRSDLFSNGSSIIYTYQDVKFGAQPTSVASRGDFVKVKLAGGCSNRAVLPNAV